MQERTSLLNELRIETTPNLQAALHRHTTGHRARHGLTFTSH